MKFTLKLPDLPDSAIPKAPSQSVYLVGDWIGWNPRKHGLKMTRIDATTFIIDTKVSLKDEEAVKSVNKQGLGRVGDSGKIAYTYAWFDDSDETGPPNWEPGQTYRQVAFGCNQMQDVWSHHKDGYITHIPHPTPGKLLRSAMPFAPNYDPNNVILHEWKMVGVDAVVTLNLRDELIDKVGFDLLSRYGQEGFFVLHLPVVDLQAPKDAADLETFSQGIDRVQQMLEKGVNVVVHCHAGIGRTGMVLAGLSKRYGYAKMLPNTTEDAAIGWTRGLVVGSIQGEVQEKTVEML
jgi:hypothetical protein